MTKVFARILQSQLFSILALFGVTILVFGSAFDNGFVYDDQVFITDWSLIQSLVNIPRFFYEFVPPLGLPDYYSPLRTFSFSVLYQLWGMGPSGYHLSALLIHLLAIYIVYRIVMRLTGKRPSAFLTGLFFAIHPVQVESVAHLAASAETWGVVLMLAAFWSYLKAVTQQDGVFVSAGQTVGLWRPQIDQNAYMASIILAGAAVFINEQSVILPVLVVWFEITARPRHASWKNLIRRLWPYVLAIGIYTFAKWRTLGLLTAGQYLEGHPYLTLMADFLALAKYMGILIFPCYLTVNHVLAPGIYSVGFDDFDSFAVLSLNFLQPFVLMSLLAVGGLIYLAWRMYARTPLVTFCLGWLLISLLPVMNIFPTNYLFAERFLYAGMMGFSLLLAQLVIVIYNCGLSGESQQPHSPVQGAAFLSIGLAVLLTVAYLVRTEWRISDWRDDVALLESAVAVNPASPELHNSLGLVYSGAGRMQEAEKQMRMAIGMRPYNAYYYFVLEEVLSNLGRYEESEATLLKAIELNPEYAQAYYNLAGLYAYRGKTGDAYSLLQKAVDAYQRQGMFIEAGEAIDSLVSYMKSQKPESEE